MPTYTIYKKLSWNRYIYNTQLVPIKPKTQRYTCNSLNNLSLQPITYRFDNIDHGSFALWMVLILQPCLLANERPQLIQVDRRGPLCVAPQVVVPHTELQITPNINKRLSKWRTCLPYQSSQDGTCQSLCDDGACHRRYRDHPDACGACLKE